MPKTQLFNRDMYFGTYKVKKPYVIEINKDFNEKLIPSIKDVCRIDKMSGAKYEDDYIVIDLTDHPYNGRVYTQIDGKLVETVLSRFITAIIRKAHLEKLVARDETKMSPLGKKRAQEEIDAINDTIESLGDQKAYVADVVLSYLDDSKSVLSLVDPIIFLFGNDVINMVSPSVTDGHSLIEFKATDSEFNGALAELDGRIRTEKKLLLPPSIFSASINITSSSVEIDSHVLKVLVNNRRVLAGTADMLFNLLLCKDVYYIDDILNRGAVLKEILYSLSVRYPMLRDQTLQKHEMITSIGDLLFTAFGDEKLLDVKIDDINQIVISSKSKGVQSMFSNITLLQALVIASVSTISKTRTPSIERFTLPNGEYIEMSIEDLRIPKDSNGVTDKIAVNKVMALVKAMNAIVHQGLKINDDSGRYLVSVEALLERVIPNLGEKNE